MVSFLFHRPFTLPSAVLLASLLVLISLPQVGFAQVDLPDPPQQVHSTDYDTLTVGQTSLWNTESTFQQQSSTFGGWGFAESTWLYTNFLEADRERDSLSTGIALGNAGTFGAEDHLTFVTGGSERMVVNNGGVGIGTQVPSEHLHVDGKMLLGPGSLPSWADAGIVGRTNAKLALHSEGDPQTDSYPSSALSLRNASTPLGMEYGLQHNSAAEFGYVRAYIDQYWHDQIYYSDDLIIHFQDKKHSGSPHAFGGVEFHRKASFHTNIGIGTTDPARDLHIAKGEPVVRLQNKGDDRVWGDRAGGYIEFLDDGGQRGGWMGFGGGYDEHLYLTNERPGKDIRFRTQQGTDMVIDESGGVGIGTTDPGAYALAVDGHVGARKVVVTDASFADYVFEDDYDLPTLREVDAFIDRNGHLPGMPSGDVVASDGQDLGTIQVALTEKVEELVLYAIEQNERAHALREQLQTERREREALASRVDRLEAQLEAVQQHLDR